ncbi:MAG: TnpV protein [Lachnospiraceae bacterium]|nr:TnpV protein [Lachnospiraceae bacterium]
MVFLYWECYTFGLRFVTVLFYTKQAGAGITEELKASDQMKWVGLMNNVKSAAEEIVAKEIIYV